MSELSAVTAANMFVFFAVCSCVVSNACSLPFIISCYMLALIAILLACSFTFWSVLLCTYMCTERERESDALAKAFCYHEQRQRQRQRRQLQLACKSMGVQTRNYILTLTYICRIYKQFYISYIFICSV